MLPTMSSQWNEPCAVYCFLWKRRRRKPTSLSIVFCPNRWILFFVFLFSSKFFSSQSLQFGASCHGFITSDMIMKFLPSSCFLCSFNQRTFLFFRNFSAFHRGFVFGKVFLRETKINPSNYPIIDGFERKNISQFVRQDIDPKRIVYISFLLPSLKSLHVFRAGKKKKRKPKGRKLISAVITKLCFPFLAFLAGSLWPGLRISMNSKWPTCV